MNHRSYVGSTKDMMERKSKHENELRGNRHPNEGLQADFNLYGEDAFLFQVVEVVKYKELVWKEIYWTNLEKNAYNKFVGGRADLEKREATKELGVAASNGSLRRMVWLRSPDGLLWVFPSIYSAAKKVGVKDKRIQEVANGYYRSLKGWTNAGL
jgi:hypothetical protein